MKIENYERVVDIFGDISLLKARLSSIERVRRIEINSDNDYTPVDMADTVDDLYDEAAAFIEKAAEKIIKKINEKLAELETL